MRLTPEQRQIIVAAVRQTLGPHTRARLFGSRTDDRQRGGDIDLLVELPELPPDAAWQAARLEARLQQLLGEQKIDVVLAGPGNADSPIVQEALRTGLPL